MKPPLSPESVVQHQLDAYNARDLEKFLAAFSEDVRLYRPPAEEAAIVGREALGAFYATQRFNHAGLHAELLGRIVLGGKVIDHERITGVQEEAFEVVVAYEVNAGLIRRLWGFAKG